MFDGGDDGGAVLWPVPLCGVSRYVYKFCCVIKLSVRVSGDLIAINGLTNRNHRTSCARSVCCTALHFSVAVQCNNRDIGSLLFSNALRASARWQ